MPQGNMKTVIRQVAVDLFYRKGYYATSISQIAQGCGIQKASIYYHYPSKEALLFHILESTMMELTRNLTRRLAGIRDVEARMRAAVRSHVRFHLERQKENFISNSELRGLSAGNFRAIVALRDGYERVIQQVIREGMAEGVFPAGDAKILSYAILTLCTAGASWFNPSGRLSIDEIAHIYEAFIISGLKRGDGRWSGCQMPDGDLKQQGHGVNGPLSTPPPAKAYDPSGKGG